MLYFNCVSLYKLLLAAFKWQHNVSFCSFWSTSYNCLLFVRQLFMFGYRTFCYKFYLSFNLVAGYQKGF